MMRGMVVGCLLIVTSVASATEDFKQIKGPEIRSRFQGMEFTDEGHSGLIFGSGGRLTSIEMVGTITAEERDPVHGSWRVRNDELCLAFGPDEPRCYQVWVSGKNVQLRHIGDAPEDGVLRKPERLR